MQDWPYADTKEQIGGTFVIDVSDLDAGLAWAEKCPAAQWGTICARAVTGVTDRQALRRLYTALVGVAPTLGARVARAAAIGRADGAACGLAALDEIQEAEVRRSQPAWVTRAHLLAELGRAHEAAQARGRYLERLALHTLRRVMRA